jgi:hypothetical protein
VPRVPLCGAAVHLAAPLRSRLRSRTRTAWPAAAFFATEAAEDREMPIDCLLPTPSPRVGVRA